MGPLTGLVVVDMTTVLMGPYATQILADMGATVIKIESPDGDIIRQIGPQRSPGMGCMFMNANRGKQSIAIDLKQKDGRALLLKLVKRADALIYNIRPQAMRRLRLDYESLVSINPRLVYVGAFGYGQDGPYAAKPAYDDLIQGLSGIPTLVRDASGADPRYVPLSIADRILSLMIVNATLGGLFHQQRTGAGQRIDVPMFESMAEFVMIDHLGGMTFEPRKDNGGYARLLSRHRRPYRTRDGNICVLVYNDKQWASFFNAISQPEKISDPRFRDHSTRARFIDAIYDELSKIIATKTTSEWLQLLEAADVPVAPLHTLETILEDPHLKAVDFFRVIQHPTEGMIRQTRVPSSWSVTQPAAGAGVPNLGEHSKEIMRDLGYCDDEIQSLALAGTVRISDATR